MAFGGVLLLAACGRGGGEGGETKLPKPDGVWSLREGLEGPMAAFGPPSAPEGVVTVTCLPRPRRTLVVTLIAPSAGAALAGDMRLRADRRTFNAPIAIKDEGVAEARLLAEDATLKALASAHDLRVEVPAAPAASLDTGRPEAPLKRVLAACR